MISPILSIFLNYIIILFAVAFLSLIEHKLLAYSQLRKGPNKPSTIGLLQPISDALKLITKENLTPLHANTLSFIIAPTIILILALSIWRLVPMSYNTITIKYTLIIFICLSSLSVYSSLAASWSSNSKYALLGTVRTIAQTISYEVSIALILISILITHPNFRFPSIIALSQSPYLYLNPLLSLIWFTTILAELNRTPFDLAEGERELVSGFNTEYSGGLFIKIFMAEYINIIFISYISIILLMYIYSSYLFLRAYLVAFCTMVIIVRSSYPRIRYDHLIYINWVFFLPAAIINIILFTPLGNPPI